MAVKAVTPLRAYHDLPRCSLRARGNPSEHAGVAGIPASTQGFQRARWDSRGNPRPASTLSNFATLPCRRLGQKAGGQYCHVGS